MKEHLMSLLFPPHCVGCGKRAGFCGFDGALPRVLCESCQKLWESEKLGGCGTCGKPVSACDCLTKDLFLAKCKGFRKLVYYRHGNVSAVQNRVIYAIKNAPSRACTRFLAGELLLPLREWAENGQIDPSQTIFVYVPRGWGVLRRTGTDQAKALAKALSEQTGIPVCPAIVRRIYRGKQQKKLSYVERRKNAKNAYRLNPRAEVRGKTVILVDDIVTTGLSMAVCARLLLRAGATDIFCLAPASDDCNQNMDLRQPKFRV